MLRAITPASLHPPFARYSHAVEVAGRGAGWSSARASSALPPMRRSPRAPKRRAELIFDAHRSDPGRGRAWASPISSAQRLCHRRASILPAYMAVRDRRVAMPPPASTLMIVSGFAREVFKVEVEAVARAGRLTVNAWRQSPSASAAASISGERHRRPCRRPCACPARITRMTVSRPGQRASPHWISLTERATSSPRSEMLAHQRLERVGLPPLVLARAAEQPEHRLSRPAGSGCRRRRPRRRRRAARRSRPRPERGDGGAVGRRGGPEARRRR